MSDQEKKRFDQIDPEQRNMSLVAEFIYMLKHNKKYWMIPLILMLLGFSLLLLLGSTGAAPFIYTLF